MAVRIFKCRACGHRVRFGVARCGNCRWLTPMMNRSLVWAVLAGFGLIGTIAVLA